MPVLVIGLVILSICVFVLSLGIYAKNTNAVCRSKKRLDGRTVVVTGGTAGMGLELARDLAQRGARVLLACPYPEEGARALETIARSSDNLDVRFKLLDLASLESTRRFAAEVLAEEARLDVLINNAGVAGPLGAVTRDGLDSVMQVNYYGAFLLTVLLLPLLRMTGRAGEPARVVNVSSVLHRLGAALPAALARLVPVTYCDSKICVVLFSRELTKRLKGSDVVINNSDPGAVGTNIFGTCGSRFVGRLVTIAFYVFSKTPWQGAQTTLHVALDKKAGEVSGEYFKNCELSRAARRAYDDKAALELWEESVRLVRLTERELERSFKS